jgi:hypothetical protein
MTSQRSPRSLYNPLAVSKSPFSDEQSAIHSSAKGTGSGDVASEDDDDVVGWCVVGWCAVARGCGMVVNGKTAGRERENGMLRCLCALFGGGRIPLVSGGGKGRQ